MEVYSAVLDLKRELLAMPVCLVFLQVAKKKFTFWTLHGPNFSAKREACNRGSGIKEFFVSCVSQHQNIYSNSVAFTFSYMDKIVG